MLFLFYLLFLFRVDDSLRASVILIVSLFSSFEFLSSSQLRGAMKQVRGLRYAGGAETAGFPGFSTWSLAFVQLHCNSCAKLNTLSQQPSLYNFGVVTEQCVLWASCLARGSVCAAVAPRCAGVPLRWVNRAQGPPWPCLIHAD